MTDLADSPREPHPDPEVEALLQFDPVVRKCVRHDGWLPRKQREFIVALTVLGQAEQAAIAAGGTMSGAYKLRTADGGKGFADAWDGALALHLRRHPRPEPKGRPSRGEILSGTGRKPWPARPGAVPAPEPLDPEEEARQVDLFWEEMIRRYRIKLQEERNYRLEGRIVEADYTVRQLTWLEVVFDLGGRAMAVLKCLKGGEHELLGVAATPMSELLGQVRRGIWLEKGEADRPPPLPFGERGPESATDPRLTYTVGRDGDPRDWELRRKEEQAVAAEAQRAWEEKARAEAEAWARREAANDDEAGQDGDAGEDGAGEGESRP